LKELTRREAELSREVASSLDPRVTPNLLGETLLAGGSPDGARDGGATNRGHHIVQVGRTYGNAGLISGYGFAPRGEQTALQIVLNAIGQAKRFVYIEDQYFTGMPALAEVLGEAARRVRHVTVLLTHDTVTDQGKHMETKLRDWMPMVGLRILAGETRAISNQAPHRRRKFIRSISQPGDNVQVFTVKRTLTESYVHSKLYIVDDEVAILGSANCCRRSFTHDSEVMAAIADQPADAICRYNFAHRLRIALWAKHLFGIIPGEEPPEADAIYAELADGVASAVHWRHPPASARIEPYDDQVPVDSTGMTDTWDAFVDPDGSLPFTDPRTSSAGT
jgi:phosphatidylserine/phosphatidylglycerophosphate/cardiolipin synthase-like enzyme